MSDNTSFFDIHKQCPNGETILLGGLAVSSAGNGQILKQQFMYEASYLSHDQATEISPLMPMSNSGVHTFDSDGRSFVGFIDDLLPDDWGKRVIARRIKARYVTDLIALSYIGNSASIGAIKITLDGETPNWTTGLDLSKADRIIEALYSGDIESLSTQELEFALLVQGGSSVGGARPKMLVLNDSIPCLIKPNQKKDKYDIAGLEWASLEVCRLAGLKAANARIYNFNDSVKSLIIERFDTTPEGGRRQLITVNSLMKDKHTQCDAMYYSYVDIANCVRKYSWNVREDLMQLFGAMLINQALNNTDDHLRNTSFILSDKGWELSPIYDVLPHDPLITEHACTFDGSIFLPPFSDAINSGKKLGLNQKDTLTVRDKVRSALSGWPALLAEQGIEDDKLLSICS